MDPVALNKSILYRKRAYWERESWGYFRSASHFWAYWIGLLDAFIVVVGVLVVISVKGHY